MTRMRGFILVLAAAMLSCSAWAADAYPTRPITLIIPYAAGGATDVGTRLIVFYIEKNLPGAKIVVVNRPGAGGEIGTTEIAHAKPDGYMIGTMNIPNTMMKPHERQARYTVDSFEPIANMVTDPAVLVTRPGGKYNTFVDVIAEAKKRPGEITVASAGIGSNTHLDLLQIEHSAGVKFTHVPFDGGAPSRNALLGGHVEFTAGTLSDMYRFAAEGKLHIIGVLSKARVEMAPKAPTFAEQGYAIEGGSSRGLVGPKGLPREIVQAIAGAVEKALKDPELIAKANELALPLNFMGTQEYAAYLKASDAELAAIWNRSPWKQ